MTSRTLPASQRAFPTTWPALITSSAASSHDVGVDGGGEAPEQAGPVPGRHGTPLLEGGGGPGDGGVGLLGRQALDGGEHLTGGWVADVHAVIFADDGPRPPTGPPAAGRMVPATDRSGAAGTVRGRAPIRDRPVQPGQGLRHARRDPGRPGMHCVARPPPELRRPAGALPPPRLLPARPRPGRRTASGPTCRAGSRARTTWHSPCTTATSTSRGCWARTGPAWRPFNVNYRYVGEELQYLLNDAKPQRHDPALLAGPDAGRGAAHAGLAPRGAAPGRGRIGPPPPPRGGLVRGGAGRILARGRTGRALPRRPLHPLHGGHHGHAQGRAVAPARHLHGGHGRAAGRARGRS